MKLLSVYSNHVLLDWLDWLINSTASLIGCKRFLKDSQPIINAFQFNQTIKGLKETTHGYGKEGSKANNFTCNVSFFVYVIYTF